MADAAAPIAGAVVDERPPFHLSVGQVTFFLTYIWVVGLYVYSLVLNKRRIGFRALKAHLSDCALDEHEHAQHQQQAAAAAGAGGAGAGAAGAAGVGGAGVAGGGPAAADGSGAAADANGSRGGGRGGKHQAGGGGAASSEPEGRPLLPVRSEGGGGALSPSSAPLDGGGIKSPSGGAELADGTTTPFAAAAAPASSSSSSSGGVAAFARELADAPLARLALRGDARVIADSEAVLRHCVEFGALLIWLFLCDRTRLFPGAEKSYSRDVFLFVFGTLVAVAGAASLSAPGRAPLLLNRPQTEEWKGWMQVLFLLYHYFEAREYYNAIRIFIAGYVWMTGYGNFSYYHKTGDFSVGRFAQMMWRLNFLVFFCCLVLNNSYMLYYICPMHTIFTVLVYGCLAAAPALNKVNSAVWAKIALSFVFVFVFWDVKPVFYAVWRPFGRLVTYVDPRKPLDKQDPMHEWFFRSSLDRYVWIYGMICAFVHPTASRWLARLDDPSKSRGRRWLERSLLLAAALSVFAVYYKTIYTLPKLDYNRAHPYTSWIPLTVWIVLRNLTPGLRLRSLRLFGWLGTITLETYLCQFHVWLRSEVSDGQPKLLLALVPGYPLVNFAVTSGLYVFVSHRFFELTNALKDVAVPHDDNRRLLRNGALLAGAFAGAMLAGWVVRGVLVAAVVALAG